MDGIGARVSSIDPRSASAPPPVAALVQYAAETDHFAGVEAALAARSVRAVRVNEWEIDDLAAIRPRVVAVKDTQSPLALAALRWARTHDVPTLLLMDGVVEYRNTFANADAGERFLRPAPVDVVACAGETDRGHLWTWGNFAVATGLPRIAAAFPEPLPARSATDGTLLVATAKRPAFDAHERERLIIALRALRDAAETTAWRGRVAWRLTAGLDGALGVQNAGGSLLEALRSAAAVITTPSTLLLEAMSAGRACGLLHPLDGPLWQSAMAESREARPESLRFMLHTLAAPSAQDWSRQHAAHLSMNAAAEGQAAPQRVAELMLRMIRGEIGAGPGRRRALPESSKFKVQSPESGSINPVAPARRVISCVSCDSTPIGGVMSWSLRMGREFAARRHEPGWEFRTLVVAMQPDGWRSDDFDPTAEPGVDLCVIDPLAPHHERIETLRAALEALAPDIVLPNYNDACFMAAAMLKPKGVRTVAIAHADDAYYRALAQTYDTWSAGVGVSAACMQWLSPIAAERPVEQIVYGVPVAHELKPRPGVLDPRAPLRLAYIGRMVEEQKRIGDLLVLLDELESRQTPCELHLVGDGPDLTAWRTRLAQRELRTTRVVIHGRRSPAWVEQFLPTLDACVLVSAYEGTSVVMLEAMGQGVVPVVTAVRSGVDEWVRDGESGVVVPIGAMAEMAAKIAALHADRSLLAKLSRGAWETIRASGLSVNATASRYAQVFDAAMRRPIDPRPSDSALRPIDLWRWNKGGSTSGDAEADAWCERALREAGFASIAMDEARPGCDAVLVRSTRAEPASAAEIAAWRERGLGVAVSPHLRQDGLAARALEVVRGAIADGARRIAIYPAGRHTRRITEIFRTDLWSDAANGEGYPFVGLLDDAARPGQQAFGLPVVRPREAMRTLAPDAVLLSSDAFEHELWRRTACLREAGVRVLALYGSDAKDPAVEIVTQGAAHAHSPG